MQHPRIYLALPVLNEFENLSSLICCLKAQTYQVFDLIVCVNQYDSWWGNHEKIHQCLNNQKSLQFLRSQDDISITLIDKSSKGQGWPEKRGGVGWARKTVMDFIDQKADKNDLIISIDADTYYPPDYIESIVNSFSSNPEITGLCVPYYHLINDSETSALILRYEIYMRSYLLNMFRIHSPYAFTALGSAMVAPVWAYRKIGGITPVKSGEDFYFLQKLAKVGKLGIWSETLAFPSSRFSDRVLFGTGPALIKGNTGDWDSYPVYKPELFNAIQDTFNLFPDLFYKEVETPLDDFLTTQFKSNDIWGPLRLNYKDQKNFIKACIVKVDGLRILQYLKQSFSKGNETIENNEVNISELIQLRERLFQEERIIRQKLKFVGI